MPFIRPSVTEGNGVEGAEGTIGLGVSGSLLMATVTGVYDALSSASPMPSSGVLVAILSASDLAAGDIVVGVAVAGVDRLFRLVAACSARAIATLSRLGGSGILNTEGVGGGCCCCC
jgi:hypothetical protein